MNLFSRVQTLQRISSLDVIVLLQTNSEKTTKQQEDADREMKELLEAESKAPAAPAAVSQKKKEEKRGKESSLPVVDSFCGQKAEVGQVSMSRQSRGSAKNPRRKRQELLRL